MDKIFVLYKSDFVLDKTHFVRADGQGIRSFVGQWMLSTSQKDVWVCKQTMFDDKFTSTTILVNHPLVIVGATILKNSKCYTGPC